MPVIFWAFALVSLLLNANHAEASTCKATKWPFAKTDKQLKAENLKVIPREHLYSYLYYELSADRKTQDKKLAQQLFNFLKKTEVNDDKYQMIQALEWAADLETKKPNTISIKELCYIEAKIKLRNKE